METIFLRGPSLNIRLVIAVFLSAAFFFLDHKLNSFSAVRVVLNSAVSPIQYVANLPRVMLNWTSTAVTTRRHLLEENEHLTKKNVLLNEQVQQMQFLAEENKRLKALLGSVTEARFK